MSRWWRAYDEAATDPKLQLLTDSLFRAWFNLMCLSSKHGGELPPLAHIAYTLQVKPEKAAQMLAQLCKCGLLDRTETGFVPHNWKARQYKSDVSTERVQRFRNVKRNVSGNADKTVSETPPETETEQKQKEPEANASGADAPPDPSIAEREFFARGREVLGKSAGGLLAKLKTAKGGNVALARSCIETASTKDNPSEYVAASMRTPVAKPLTPFQQRQSETNDVRAELRQYANGGSGGGSLDSFLPKRDGGRPEGLRSGASPTVLAIPGASGGGGDRRG